MLKEAWKKSTVVTALLCALGCTALCMLLTGILSFPVYSQKLPVDKTGLYTLVFRFLSSLLFSALTAKAASSRKLPFALLCGAVTLALFFALGALCFGGGSFDRDFALCAVSLMGGSLAGGILAALSKKRRR